MYLTLKFYLFIQKETINVYCQTNKSDDYEGDHFFPLPLAAFLALAGAFFGAAFLATFLAAFLAGALFGAAFFGAAFFGLAAII